MCFRSSFGILSVSATTSLTTVSSPTHTRWRVICGDDTRAASETYQQGHTEIVVSSVLCVTKYAQYHDFCTALDLPQIALDTTANSLYTFSNNTKEYSQQRTGKVHSPARVQRVGTGGNRPQAAIEWAW